MKPQQLILKCYAEKKEDIWQAFCLDFDLAVQGDSFNEVKVKLEGIVSDYVKDALVGEDKEHAAQLLNRRAPISMYIKYYLANLTSKFTNAKNEVIRLIKEPMPLYPKGRCSHNHL